MGGYSFLKGFAPGFRGQIYLGKKEISKVKTMRLPLRLYS